MFRVEGEKNVYEALTRRIKDNPKEEIDYNNYDMFDLCSALKYYFKEVKKGILTREATESLFHVFINNKKGDLKELSKYLRGYLYSDRESSDQG